MPDLETLFAFSVPPLELVVRGTILYLGLVLLFRFALRRDLGQLGVPDMLIIVLVADAAQNGMAGEYRSITDAVVLLGTLAFWNVMLDWATYRFHWAQALLEPPTVELVRDGRILRRNLRREWVTVEELMGKLREEGITDVNDVKLAMLEADGQLSVLKAAGKGHSTDPTTFSTAGKHIGAYDEPDDDARTADGRKRGSSPASPPRTGERPRKR